MKKLRYIVLIMFIALTSVGFDDCGTDPAIGPGDLRIQHRLQTTSLGSPLLTPYAVTTSGEHVQDSGDFNLPYPSGGNYSFGPGTTGTDGRYSIANGRGPALWRIHAWSGPCHNQFGVFFLKHAEETKVDCVEIGGIFLPPGTVAPRVIAVSNPPYEVTIYGQDMSAVGGMPLVEYYNSDGNLAQQAYATSCAQDGSWVSGPPPDLTDCVSGQYTLIVRNADGDAVGSGTVNVFNYTPCTSDPEAVASCEMALGLFWDYDHCQCVDHNW